MNSRSLSWRTALPLLCGKGPARWVRSSRMNQSPRASSASQSWQAGTLGHLARAALTISSMGRSLTVARQPGGDGLGHGHDMAGETAAGKAHMAAVRGLPQRDMTADLVRARQAGRRHEGVVQGVEHQRWNADGRQVRPGRGAGPVIERAAKAVQDRK